MKSAISPSIAAYSLFFAALPANSAETSLDVHFNAQEALVIRDYCRQYTNPATSGSNRAKSIPSGVAKNIDRGKPLPPGIVKQALPGALLDQLPPVRQGYERIVVNGQVLLVEITTRVIHDILTNAVLNQ